MWYSVHTLYTLIIIPLMIFAWPRFDRTILIQALFCVVIGWWLLMVTTEAQIGMTHTQINEKWLAGPEVTLEEESFDGVGDRAISLFWGWFPAVLMVLVSCGLRGGFHRFRAKHQIPENIEEVS